MKYSANIAIATAVLTTSISLSHAAVTAGYDFYVNASLDTDGDDRWEDLTIGNPTGQEFLLDVTSSNPVTRVTGTSTYSGISAAYKFAGGSTGNDAGAEMVGVGGTSGRSFHDSAGGDWTNASQSVSLELWFKPDSLTHTPLNGQILFEDGGGTGISLCLNDDVIDFRAPSISAGIVSSSSISSLAGEFIQVVGVWNPSAGGVMTIYVNGTLAGETSGITGTDWSGGDGAALGTMGEANTGGLENFGQSTTESFAGEMALFRAYRDQALTATEVANNYHAVVPEPSSALLLGLGCLSMISRRKRT